MGLNWAQALAQGGAAMAGAGAELADKQLKEEAEMRAADRKLSDAERLLAIQDAMKNRAAERFSSVVKAKAGEEVPQEAASVSQTGLTPESRGVVGKTEDGKDVISGFQGSPETIQKIVENMNAVLKDPNATPENKAEAKAALEALGAQVKTQGAVNAKATEGKTRKRTWDEAIQAAREDTLMNDAPAFMAGEGMLAAERKESRDDKRADAAAKVASAKTEIEMRKEEGRDRRHQESMDALEARLDKRFGGKDGAPTALMQNAEYLRSLGYTPEKIEKFIFEKKEISLEDLAAKILAGDKTGDMTAEEAAQQAVKLKNALSPASAPKPAGSQPAQTSASRPPLSSFLTK